MTRLQVEALGEKHREEVLDFLSVRPLHTVCMAGYIRDHSIVNPLNRGLFFGCRNPEGELEGVALIGHATLIETQNDQALKEFAQLGHTYPTSRLIRGEQEMIDRFWQYYSDLGQPPRSRRSRSCQELLFEFESASPFEHPLPALKPATLKDLEAVAEINSRMIVVECGVDPLKNDPIGFRERLTRRLMRNRIWILKENERILFKADVFAQTPQMAFVEGVFVAPGQRGQGLGVKCLTHFNQILLKRSHSLCLVINERMAELRHFYEKAGYKFRGVYQTIYFNSQAAAPCDPEGGVV